MASPATIYTESTILLFFDMWDKSISEERPEHRPDDAWLLEADVDEITLTIRKPGETPDEEQTLTTGITYSGKAGRWQAHFDLDAGAGLYSAIFVGVTTDGYTGVEVTKMRVKAWPA